MTHRIRPGDRYKLDPTGPTYENTLPHDIIVDRQPIFVGGTINLGDGVRPRPVANKIEVVFDTGGHFAGLFSDSARKRMDHALDAAIMNGVYGKSRLWEPTLRDIAVAWPSPKKETPFPAFVAPERPAEPEAPKPAPDTPAVATLKALLADRQREVGKRKANAGFEKENVADCAEALVEAERALESAKQDLAHAETVLAAATAEVDAVISDIVKLGGTVGAAT